MSGFNVGAVSHWPVEDSLQRYVAGFDRLSIAAPPGERVREVMFPSWATIYVTLYDSPRWSLKIGKRNFDPVPTIAFVGPTSSAGYVDAAGGTLVSMTILPSGWSRLFGGDVSRFANRVVPMESLDPGTRHLREALEAADVSPVEAFTQWVADRLARRPEADPRIDQLLEIYRDPQYTRIDMIADKMGMTPRMLATVTRANFGFTPKLLMRRTRFLRALAQLLRTPENGAEVLRIAGYWDRSHFLRDSHLFLGCSIRDFNKRRGAVSNMWLRLKEDRDGLTL
jgi:AraC-like DNA-binding protein